jgi:uncharacterized protein
MIDFHVHQPTAVGDAEAAYTAADYVEFMTSVGITLSVVFTFDGLLHVGSAGNDELQSYVASSPEQLIGFGTCDPRDPTAPDEVERCFRDLGFRGLKFHPWLQGFCPHERFMDPICEIAAAYDAPILFHDGTPPYSTSLQIATLAARHPSTTVVLGHGGLHDMWREAIAAARATPNIVICMCGLPRYAMTRVARSCPLDRVVFGTDGGLGPLGPNSYVATRIRHLETAGFSESELAAILDTNPRRLLKI